MLQDNIQRNLEVTNNSLWSTTGDQRPARAYCKSNSCRWPEQARQASNEHLAYIEETLVKY